MAVLALVPAQLEAARAVEEACAAPGGADCPREGCSLLQTARAAGGGREQALLQAAAHRSRGAASAAEGGAALVRKVDNIADTVERHGKLFETIQADLAALKKKKVLDKQFEAHLEIAKTLISLAVARDAMLKLHNLQCVYSVIFPVEEAKDFIALTRLDDSNMTWKDSRNCEPRLLRARPDQTVDVARKQKLPGKLWGPILQEAGLGASGPTGVLFATSADDVWDFFALQEAPGETFSTIPNEANLADDIITAAASA
ncbi:unnamed protein product [Prorocentrum cordatum]|uniref:Uncharacterized protein n=1 Tax=Prorocentrum cordatum TaxID=2364126 RepID=A0ABN9UQM2_9DINO|nr:unnamed protein product [Polarella glacialis]